MEGFAKKLLREVVLVLVLCIGGMIVATLLGCGEAAEDEGAAGMLGTTKMPEMAPAAPSAPEVPEGTPTVVSVGYYGNWRLTNKLSGTVKPGKKIFIKIVFSEPMKHRSGDSDARPILYYRLGEERHRFRVREHGAGGKGKETFVSGDVKPFQSGTDDFVCKYIVPADANGERFRIEIGRYSTDLDGNKLPAYYTHAEQLQCGPVPTTKPTQPETPADDTVKKPVEPTDTTPPTVVSITHHNDRTGAVIADGETVPHGTTINTEIVFSEAVKPSITYTTAGGKVRLYTVSTQGGVHWRGRCKPVDKDETTWLCKQSAIAPSFMVTVTTNTTDRAGNALVEAVVTEIPVARSVVVVPPQEPIDTEPEPKEPEEPTEPEPPPGDIGDLGYTFTFPSGETYPGYNPSPGLQHILNTHPSAKLPHFHEAVQMVEVIDWVYRKAWTVYPNWKPQDSEDRKKLSAAHKSVDAQFGISASVTGVLSNIYFNIFDSAFIPWHSRYWMKVEYLRLKLEHPEKGSDDLLNLFGENKKNVVGTINPND